jgi:hypothetical protein
VSLEPDPVIEYYKQFIDRSLRRENLKLTPTERVRKFLPSTTYECHHDPPRDPQNPNEGLTPCKDGCVVKYFGRLLHCPGYLDGTIQERDVGFDPDRQRSAWAYQELRRFIGCRADREHWQEFLTYKCWVRLLRTVESHVEVCDTNCAAKVRECTGLESPLTPTLSPLDKGGEGREWGDSARAGICELWLGDWYNRRLGQSRSL